MLLANIAAAQRIYKAFPDCALLRQHDAPNERKLAQAVKTLLTEGFEVHCDRFAECGCISLFDCASACLSVRCFEALIVH
jgi:hypothetical protein